MKRLTSRALAGSREDVIWAEVLNRKEDKMDLYFVDAKSGKSRIVLTETTPGAWIDFEHVEVRFLKSSGGFVWPSWRDGNMHLYFYSFDKQNPLAADAKLERQLTQGDFEVLGIEGVDEAAGTVFFSANKDDPRQRHLFSVKLDGTGLQPLTHDEGMYSGIFSDDGKHYEQTFASPLTAPRTSLCAVGGACTPVWQARDAVAEYGLRAPKFLEFKAEDGTMLYGRLLLPPDAPASGKIPLIVNIYGGPGGADGPERAAEIHLTKSWRAKVSPSFPSTIAELQGATASSKPQFVTSSARSS